MNLSLDNALIHQKDHIIDKIDNGHYEEAITLLTFTKELWAVETYSYKWLELQTRLLNTLRNQQETQTHWKQLERLREIAQRVIKL